MSQSIAPFGFIDGCVVIAYFGIIIAIGALASRRTHTGRGFFLGDREMPVWAVSLSVLATTLSAATFISVPELAFRSDLRYLILNLGGIIGAVIVAVFFIPPLYRAGTITVYGYLEKRFGEPSRIAASLIFLFGRLLASGARLFIAAIAVSLILFGETDRSHLIVAILLFGTTGILYTVWGGIRAVIWTDALQIVVVVVAAVSALYLLLDAIPLGYPDLISALRNAEGGDKLALVDLRFDLALPFTLWSGLIASTFVSTSAYSVDQDMVQRMLTTRTWRGGGISLIASTLVGIPVVFMFLAIGLLLSIYYGRPELMGAEYPSDVLSDTKAVFPQFLLNHLPTGIKGLAIAGLVAAAMSSLDSAMNAMGSSLMADLVRPFADRKRRTAGGGTKATTGAAVDEHGGYFTQSGETLAHSRVAVLVSGLLLMGFAIVAVFLHSSEKQSLIDFALGIMAFANAPLLGVFAAAIFTRRGNNTSVIAAIGCGMITVLLLQPCILERLVPQFKVAWPWWWVIAAPISFLVCILGPSSCHRPR